MTIWSNVATSYYSIKNSEQSESLEKTINVSFCIILNFMAKLINARNTIEAINVILQFTGGFVQKKWTKIELRVTNGKYIELQDLFV